MKKFSGQKQSKKNVYSCSKNDNKRHLTTLIMVLLAISCAPLSLGQAYRKVDSEYKILADYLYPQMLDRAIPVGRVDRNSPWLAYNPWLSQQEMASKFKTKKEKRAYLDQKFTRKYFFELSTDKSFKRDVLKSGPIGWSFWNPFQKLAVGIWYWRVTYVNKDGMKPIFPTEKYCFQITGDEYEFIPPSPQKMIDIIHKTPSPRVICPKNMMGSFNKVISSQQLNKLEMAVKKIQARKLRPFKSLLLPGSDLVARSTARKEEIRNYSLDRTINNKLSIKKINQEAKRNTDEVATLIRAYVVKKTPSIKEITLHRFREVYANHKSLTD